MQVSVTDSPTLGGGVSGLSVGLNEPERERITRTPTGVRGVRFTGTVASMTLSQSLSLTHVCYTPVVDPGDALAGASGWSTNLSSTVDAEQ